MMRLFLLLSGLMALRAFSQEPPVLVQQQLENLVDATENDQVEDDHLLLVMDHLKKHPLNINTVTVEELRPLRMLSDLQVDHLMLYRKIFGNFLDIYELQAIPYWDIQTIRKVLPYLYAGASISVRESMLSRLNGDHSFLLRFSRTLQKPVGYDTAVNNHYLGDRNRLMFRYRYQYKDLLYFGIVGDKDAGEQFFRGAQSKGFDFYSIHFSIKKLGLIKCLALGDYTVNLGQGLVYWQSMGLGKSSDAMAIKRQSAVMVPYRSAGEFNFNRGAAFTIQKGRIESSLFLSHKKINGNVKEDNGKTFSGILTSGYSRNGSEIADKNQVSHTSIGGNLCYVAPGTRIGLNAVMHRFNKAFQKKAEPYNLFQFSGRQLFNASLDYHYTYRNIHLFGEAALDKEKNRALLHGAILSLSRQMDLTLLFRNLARDYQSLFGNAFTANTLPVNETGLYLGVTFRPSDHWHLNAYADFFKFPWLKYRVNGPSAGHDYLLQWTCRPSRHFEMYMRYRQESRTVNNNNEAMIPYPSAISRQNLRIHLESVVTSLLTIRSRVEMVWFDRKGQNAEEGFMAYVEGIIQPSPVWKAHLRLQYFQTNGYNSRIYAYESDVLYSFSIPAFFDTGLRYYCNLQLKSLRDLNAWLRWSQSIFKDRNETGSGLDMIPGNSRSDLKIQFLYNF